jgi:hypothetical protein
MDIVDKNTSQFYARILAKRRSWIIQQLGKLIPDKKVALHKLLNDFTSPDKLESKAVLTQ